MESTLSSPVGIWTLSSVLFLLVVIYILNLIKRVRTIRFVKRIAKQTKSKIQKDLDYNFSRLIEYKQSLHSLYEVQKTIKQDQKTLFLTNEVQIKERFHDIQSFLEKSQELCNELPKIAVAEDWLNSRYCILYQITGISLYSYDLKTL